MKGIIQINENGMLSHHGTILECACGDHLYEFEYVSDWEGDRERILNIRFWGDEYRRTQWGRLRWAWHILTRGYNPHTSIELGESDVEAFINTLRNAYDYDRDEPSKEVK
jgi:hypothetical protein